MSIYALLASGISEMIVDQCMYKPNRWGQTPCGKYALESKYHNIVIMETKERLKALNMYSLIELKEYLIALIPYTYYDDSNEALYSYLPQVQAAINMVESELHVMTGPDSIRKNIDLLKTNNDLKKENDVLKKELLDIKNLIKSI